MSEILPETKVLFWNKTLREEWKPRFQKMSKVYNATEFETFNRGLRDIYIYHINSNRFDNSYEFLRKYDLLYYPTNKSAIYQGFSHKHLPVEPGKPYTLYGAVVKNKKIGENFVKLNEHPTDHVSIGKLLGYPDCCTSFFLNKWGPSVDPMYEAATQTDGAKIKDKTVTLNAHPFCNQMLRYFGFRITPHLSCSMNCKQTIKMGKKWFSIMEELDPDAASDLYYILSSPITWNCLNGVAIIDTEIFRGVTNSDIKKDNHIIINEGYK